MAAISVIDSATRRADIHADLRVLRRGDQSPCKAAKVVNGISFAASFRCFWSRTIAGSLMVRISSFSASATAEKNSSFLKTPESLP